MTQRLALVLLMIVLLPSVSFGIFATGSIVHDPINWVENQLTKAQTAISNTNEAAMIARQVEQIAQQAKHLVELPVNMVNQINDAMLYYNRLMAQYQQTLYQYKNMVEQFDQVFASGFAGGDLMQQARNMMSKVRQVGSLATQTENMYQRLIGQQQRVNTVLLASQAAPGSRSLQQANNQLLGTLNEQLAAMQMMQAAHGEMQKTWIMRQVVAEERAMANAQEHLMIDQSALPTLGIGTGKGFTLP